jgi:paired small multidrug resistance pump
MTLYSIIGLMGVLVVLIAYGLMTAGRLAASSARYQWLNVCGTLAILVSMLEQWNLPAFIANVLWVAIGAYSLVRLYKGKASQFCHSREGGNPLALSEGDSHLRGNDKSDGTEPSRDV